MSIIDGKGTEFYSSVRWTENFSLYQDVLDYSSSVSKSVDKFNLDCCSDIDLLDLLNELSKLKILGENLSNKLLEEKRSNGTLFKILDNSDENVKGKSPYILSVIHGGKSDLTVCLQNARVLLGCTISKLSRSIVSRCKWLETGVFSPVPRILIGDDKTDTYVQFEIDGKLNNLSLAAIECIYKSTWVSLEWMSQNLLVHFPTSLCFNLERQSRCRDFAIIESLITDCMDVPSPETLLAIGHLLKSTDGSNNFTLQPFRWECTNNQVKFRDCNKRDKQYLRSHVISNSPIELLGFIRDPFSIGSIKKSEIDSLNVMLDSALTAEDYQTMFVERSPLGEKRYLKVFDSAKHAIGNMMYSYFVYNQLNLKDHFGQMLGAFTFGVHDIS